MMLTTWPLESALAADSTAAAPDLAAPDGTAADEWPLWSTAMRVVVTDATRLQHARAVVDAVLADVADACDRFSPDSQLSRLSASLSQGVVVSDTLAELVSTALWAARQTDGDVDFTLGGVLAGLGYDRDIDELRASASASTAADTLATPAGSLTVMSRVPGWRRVGLDGRLLTVPADLTLDLGATAKAFAADRAASRVFEEVGCGVLVSLGGDIATAGAAPEGGWQLRVHDLDGDPASTITLSAGHALATSSTQKRRWQRAGRGLHHILDPRLGLPAEPVWRTVTVAAPSCVRANTLSTASIVRGYRAVGWLSACGPAARLVDASGRVLTLGGWPDENSVHVRAAS